MTSDHPPRRWLQPTAEDLRVIEEEEALERPLLKGRWVSAMTARDLAMNGADQRNAEAFLLRAAAKEHNRRPMLRTKAAKAETVPPRFRLPVRRDRIVHSFDWDGKILAAQWQAGFFELRSRHFSDRTVTLIGVEFSLDDLEGLLGPHCRSASTPPAATDPAPFSTEQKLVTTAKRHGRPKGTGLVNADAPFIEEMRHLLDANPALSPTKAAQQVAARAAGDGTFESKVTRLVKAYKKQSETE